MFGSFAFEALNLRRAFDYKVSNSLCYCGLDIYEVKSSKIFVMKLIALIQNAILKTLYVFGHTRYIVTFSVCGWCERGVGLTVCRKDPHDSRKKRESS